MNYWIVKAMWSQSGGENRISRTFTGRQQAEAFVDGGNPLAGSGLSSAPWQPADPANVHWEIIHCDLAAQPWVCSLNPYAEGPPGHGERFRSTLAILMRYFCAKCDSVLAFGWDGAKVEGPLTSELRRQVERDEWFGLQLYRGEATLFHLDDGSDNYFVVDEQTFVDLMELGLEPDDLRPEHPAAALHRAGPGWTGG